MDALHVGAIVILVEHSPDPAEVLPAVKRKLARAERVGGYHLLALIAYGEDVQGEVLDVVELVCTRRVAPRTAHRLAALGHAAGEP